MNINTTTIVGRLTADPEISKTKSGISVCRFTLAVARPGVKETTDFVDCVTWRQSADFLCRYGHKGQECGITGQIQTRTYEDRDGRKRKVTEVVGNVQLTFDSKRRETIEETDAIDEFDAGDDVVVSPDDLPF